MQYHLAWVCVGTAAPAGCGVRHCARELLENAPAQGRLAGACQALDWLALKVFVRALYILYCQRRRRHPMVACLACWQLSRHPWSFPVLAGLGRTLGRLLSFTEVGT